MTRLHTLGTVDLRGRDGRPMQAVLYQPKRLALLAYLAVATPRGFHRRDKLVALFWPEVDADHARGALNQAVYMLRRALSADVLVSRGGEEIGLRQDGLWSDAAAFEAALDEGREEEGLALYRGDLLDGFFISDAPEFERWLDGERARLRGRAALSAWALAEAHEKRGEMSEAAERARQAAALAPGDERSLRRLVSLENISPVSVAILYCKLGEWDKAFAWLERAADERDPAIVELKQEPLLDPLRSDQRFARLAERVGLP